MASPSSTTDDANKREQITFRFCTECSNMLYPKEDQDSRKLLYTCRTCQFVEDAATTCVFRNMINSASGETAGVTQDVATDPTLPREKQPCPKCQGQYAVFFQSQQRTADTGMKLFYVCCDCGHIFQ